MMFPHFSRIKTIILLLFVLTSLPSFAQKEATIPKTVMLILGSDNLETLKERVDVGYKLYSTAIPFDYIIVSGGCGAHKSKLCEATEMANLLMEKGVPAEKIFKEEKSKTTVQNYVYSRSLKKPNGEKLINPNDRLYVVSNHWHAISVAARFATYDGVDATYHIEGSIIPSGKDKVDYVGIFHGNTNNEDFCRSALWPYITASFSLVESGKQKTFYFIDNLIAQIVEGTQNPSFATIADTFSFLPERWKSGIDAAFYHEREKKIYLLKGTEYLRFSPNAKSLDKGYPASVKGWLRDLPESWEKGHFDAAFYNANNDEIFIFKDDDYIKCSAKKPKVTQEYPKKISTWVQNWPFEWGTGNIDAAYYNGKEQKIYLYRGNEHIKVSLEGLMEEGHPKRTTMKKPDQPLKAENK